MAHFGNSENVYTGVLFQWFYLSSYILDTCSFDCLLMELWIMMLTT